MEIRYTRIYVARKGISNEWYERKTIILVIRNRKKKGKREKEYAYYISDIPVTKGAAFFDKLIRGHWGIENSLHYIKDVSQGEDRSKIRTGSQAQNISILRNICLNLFREHGYKNIAEAMRLVSHNIPLMNRRILA